MSCAPQCSCSGGAKWLNSGRCECGCQVLAAFDEMRSDYPEPGQSADQLKVLFRINRPCVFERNSHIVALCFQNRGPLLFMRYTFCIGLLSQAKHGIEMCITHWFRLATYIELLE